MARHEDLDDPDSRLKALVLDRVSDPSSFDTGSDPAFEAEYRSGTGSNPDLGSLRPKIKKIYN